MHVNVNRSSQSILVTMLATAVVCVGKAQNAIGILSPLLNMFRWTVKSNVPSPHRVRVTVCGTSHSTEVPHACHLLSKVEGTDHGENGIRTGAGNADPWNVVAKMQINVTRHKADDGKAQWADCHHEGDQEKRSCLCDNRRQWHPITAKSTPSLSQIISKSMSDDRGRECCTDRKRASADQTEPNEYAAAGLRQTH
jgi:hypothetical protein